MLVLLLAACDGGDVTDGARARSQAWLDAHPVGTAVVRARLGEEGVEAVVGTRWHGADLAEWLAPCALGDGTFDAVLRLEPGRYPWELLDDEGVPACAAERLSRFPFEEPSRRAEVDLVMVRWRAAETAPAASETPPSETRSGVPAGLLALAPPYYRRSPSGDALAPDSVHFDDGRVRIRATDADDVVAGALESPDAWARQLTCTDDEDDGLGLVRLVILFDDGYVEEIHTEPHSDCMEERVRDRDRATWLQAQTVGGTPIRDAGRVLAVLDVPVGPW